MIVRTKGKAIRVAVPAIALGAMVLSGCVVKYLSTEAGNPKWGLEVAWHGHSCFSLRDSADRTVVLDPFDETVGYGRLDLLADALLITHRHFDHDNKRAVKARAKDLDVVESTGTFTVAAGLQVTGLPATHDTQNGEIHGANIIYLFVMGGLRCAHLGDLGSAELTDFQRKMIGKVDVLFLPVGGVTTIDAAGAKKLVDELKPAAVFPMHFGNIRFFPLGSVDTFAALFPSGQVRRVNDSHVRLREADLTEVPVVYILTPVSKN